MPFRPCPCSIWLATESEPDEWNNTQTAYSDDPDITTTCVYTPGTSAPSTSDDIEDGRPHGDVVAMTFYLPKTLDADLREALIACHPTDDAYLSGQRFKVVGNPYSYPRANTPGDYSWVVDGVTYLG